METHPSLFSSSECVDIYNEFKVTTCVFFTFMFFEVFFKVKLDYRQLLCSSGDVSIPECAVPAGKSPMMWACGSSPQTKLSGIKVRNIVRCQDGEKGGNEYHGWWK